MVKKVEHEFCMTQFKPAIAGLAVLLVLVLGWTAWHCTQRGLGANFALAAVIKPTAPPISVKDKMLHPYWGNCNKCHLTIDPGKPVSKVMAGAPISIKAKMPHKYWGNCLLCHQVVDGIQPRKRAVAVALHRVSAQTLGLKIQTVTAATMRKFGLPNEEGVLVLAVSPNSIGARSGLQQGDEIIRVGKVRVESANGFEASLNIFKPGSKAKINIYRGKKKRNLFVRFPKNLHGNITPAAATAPMTQNQVETLAEQLGVPKTQQDVARALQRQAKGQAAANLNYGQVAVATTGPGLGYQVSHRFGASPYFIVVDPALNSYRVVANPNANDATGRGVQTGQYMVDLRVSNVIAGTFSQNALHTLRTLRVNVYSGVVGPVQNVLTAYKAGRLTPVNANPVQQLASPRGHLYPQGGSQKVQTIY